MTDCSWGMAQASMSRRVRVRVTNTHHQCVSHAEIKRGYMGHTLYLINISILMIPNFKRMVAFN
jgi:hypothetical protein